MFSTTVIAEKKWYTFGNPHLDINWEDENFEYVAALLMTEDLDEPIPASAIGTQCCLGFESVQCGIPLKNLGTASMPEGIIVDYDDYNETAAEIRHRLIPHLVSKNNKPTSFSSRAAAINDNEEMTYENKKKAMQELWAKQGWKLIFVLTVTEMRRKIKELKAKGE